MRSAEIHIPTSWRVKGIVSDVYDILSNPTDFVRWWSSVYLEVEELESGADDGVGRIVRVHTKGKLPYTLSWVAEASEIEKPTRIVVRATGDLQGFKPDRRIGDADAVTEAHHGRSFEA